MSAQWTIKYLDQHQREMHSTRFKTRKQAVRQAGKWQNELYKTVLAIIGPSGEEPWAQVKWRT